MHVFFYFSNWTTGKWQILKYVKWFQCCFLSTWGIVSSGENSQRYTFQDTRDLTVANWKHFWSVSLLRARKHHVEKKNVITIQMNITTYFEHLWTWCTTETFVNFELCKFGGWCHSWRKQIIKDIENFFTGNIFLLLPTLWCNPAATQQLTAEHRQPSCWISHPDADPSNCDTSYLFNSNYRNKTQPMLVCLFLLNTLLTKTLFFFCVDPKLHLSFLQS